MKRLRRWFKLKDSEAGKETNTTASASASTATGSDDEYPSFKLNVETFSFSELSAATADFSTNHQIGSGSSCRVYEGHLAGIGKVAVKRLCFDGSSRRDSHRKNEFHKEVYVLNSMKHPNIVKLIGCCSEEAECLLVYEYMPLGTLRECLSDEKIALDWSTRMNIALGAAKGLEQLHCGCNPPIIHRDFKSTNILLDKNFQPKVSDFGTAKIAPAGDEIFATSTAMKGTPGYIAPEIALGSPLSIRSDIYSFGVVLLEIITGSKAIDNTRQGEEQNLACWARGKSNDRSKFEELLDPRLRDCVSLDVLSMALAVAVKCIMEDDSQRPEIQRVIKGLQHVISKSRYPEASSSSSTYRHGVSVQGT
ncbi:hypothetical protein ACP70R_017856 [Stipagrostis hirtigluma subsp. patula]